VSEWLDSTVEVSDAVLWGGVGWGCTRSGWVHQRYSRDCVVPCDVDDMSIGVG
jgi:hypothetical protein